MGTRPRCWLGCAPRCSPRARGARRRGCPTSCSSATRCCPRPATTGCWRSGGARPRRWRNAAAGGSCSCCRRGRAAGAAAPGLVGGRREGARGDAGAGDVASAPRRWSTRSASAPSRKARPSSPGMRPFCGTPRRRGPEPSPRWRRRRSSSATARTAIPAGRCWRSMADGWRAMAATSSRCGSMRAISTSGWSRRSAAASPGCAGAAST